MQRIFRTFQFMGILAAVAIPIAVMAAAKAATKGKIYTNTYLTIATPGLPGESNFRHATLLSKFLRRYIPGKPRIVVHMKNSSLAAANYAHNNMPRDGRHLLMPGGTILVQQLLELEKVSYDARDFIWLGLASQPNSVLVARRSARVKSIKDLKRKNLIVPVRDVGSTNYILPKLAQEMLGLKMTLLRGHDEGQTYTMMIVENGLLRAGAAFSWEAWKSTVPQWFKEGLALPILQTGYPARRQSLQVAGLSKWAGTAKGAAIEGVSLPAYSKHPDLPSVPLLSDLVSAEDRAIFDLIWSEAMIGHGLLLPPGVEAEKVAILRAAFASTMKDPEYLARAQKQGIRIRPSTGETMSRRVSGLFAKAGGSLVARARHMLIAGKRRHR